jgi:transposase-like protein
MDPATPFCPNLACPARGQTGQGHMRLHSCKDQRVLCTECHKTFSATTGTAWYRLRTSAATVSLVVTLLAQGCPLQAIVVAFGCDERTVAAWWARAGRQGQAVQEHLVEHPRDLGQVPAEAIRVKTQGGIVWMALALMVKTRLWRAGEVRAPRHMPLMRQLIARVRRCAMPRPLVLCTDGLSASVRARRETCRDPRPTGAQGRPRLRPWRHLYIAQVVKRDAQRHVVDVERRLIDGTPARVETRRRRAQGNGVINTADIERLHATCRERLASLTRRGRALARRPLTLQHGMYLIGSVYNFCTYHASLRLAASAAGMPCLKRPPAMAAGLTDHGWTVQERLSFPVPPPRWIPPKPRGRPSRALKRLLERWCS